MNTIVTEPVDDDEISVDLYQKLSNNRILFITDYIDDKVATDIVATLLLKDSEDRKSKITLFINSEGGDIRNVLMIYDMMKLVKSPIETVCIGSAMDESTIILASGTPGMRFATKNSLISINQLTHENTALSDLTDAKKSLDQYMIDNKKMIEIIARKTGKKIKQITEKLNRRLFMTAQQAIRFGLIDKVVSLNK